MLNLIQNFLPCIIVSEIITINLLTPKKIKLLAYFLILFSKGITEYFDQNYDSYYFSVCSFEFRGQN